MGKKDTKTLLSEATELPFIIEILTALSLIVAPIILMIKFGPNAAFISALMAGILVVIYALFKYRARVNPPVQGPSEADFHSDLNSRLTETFIIQIIFGVAMVVAGLFTIVSTGFDISIIMTLISGGLLIAYSLYFYAKVQTYLAKLGEKGDQEYNNKVRIKLNETFIIQLIFGVAMVVVGLYLLITGFDLNVLMTIISGALLIVYSIYYYRVQMSLQKPA